MAMFWPNFNLTLSCPKVRSQGLHETKSPNQAPQNQALLFYSRGRYEWDQSFKTKSWRHLNLMKGYNWIKKVHWQLGLVVISTAAMVKGRRLLNGQNKALGLIQKKFCSIWVSFWLILQCIEQNMTNRHLLVPSKGLLNYHTVQKPWWQWPA